MCREVGWRRALSWVRFNAAPIVMLAGIAVMFGLARLYGWMYRW
mgnify:CR=1 FL=1|jgi:hypothetical protein